MELALGVALAAATVGLIAGFSFGVAKRTGVI